MDDESPESEQRYPVSTAKMSKTPSWIMLGFLLGAAFVLALPPLRRKAPPETATIRAVEPPAAPAGPREPPLLSTIEDVFAIWGRHAVWSDNLTEVALWNVRDQAFNQFFEVRRDGDTYYFRTISRLTRRIVARGKHIAEAPLQFTETEEQYAEWQKYGRNERPVERESRPRPAAPAPSAAPMPAPVDRTLRSPVLPHLELTPPAEAAKKSG